MSREPGAMADGCRGKWLDMRKNPALLKVEAEGWETPPLAWGGRLGARPTGHYGAD